MLIHDLSFSHHQCELPGVRSAGLVLARGEGSEEGPFCCKLMLGAGGGWWWPTGPAALSPLDCLLDGQMKAWLLSMQMVAQVTLQLKKMIRSFLLGWLETSLCSRE